VSFDEEIGYAVLSVAVKDQWCFRGDTLESNLPSYRAISQATVDLIKGINPGTKFEEV